MTKYNNRDSDLTEVDENRDPISGAHGAHPVGTGLGATGGAVTGAAIGAVAGPIGAGIGLVSGAVAGGLAGKAVAEGIDPTVEEAYWRDEYPRRSYADNGIPYETYQPAYELGYQGYGRYSGKSYDEVEPELRREYEEANGNSNLSWDKARCATRDAWDRLECATHCDTDGDRR